MSTQHVGEPARSAPGAVSPEYVEPVEQPPTRRARYPTPHSSVADLIGQAWRNRALAGALGSRLFARRFSRTKFGQAWYVIRPLMSLFGMSLLFGGILAVSPGADVPYPLFLVFALGAWRFFQEAVYWATLSFDRFARLTRKLDFPLLLVPIGGMSIAIVNLAVFISIGLVLVIYYLVADGEMYLQFGPELLLAVAGLSLCLLMAWGLGMFTSVLNAHARDVRFSIRYVLQFWFFLTPVIYPLSQVPEGYRTLAQLNPMTAPIDLIKEGLLGIGQVDLGAVAWSIGFTAMLCVAGLLFFSRFATNFMGPTGWAQDEDSRLGDDDEDDTL